jgi:ferritin
MLSKKLAKKLNDQINFEYYSSNVYLQMSAWAEYNALPGTAAFLKTHAAEELAHMHRIFKYVNETGSLALVGKLDAPPTEFKSIAEVFNEILAHEKLVTKKINEITAIAWEEKDFATFNFLQWFVDEQHEEETLVKGIVDKINLIGSDKRALFLIDRELARMAAAPSDD